MNPAAIASPAIARLAGLPPKARRKVIKSLPRPVRAQLLYSWEFWGRPDQVWTPGDERFTAYLAGRGWGKTRTGAEAVRYVAERPWLCGGRRPSGPNDQTYGRGGWIGIAGRTANDVNETMLHGPSGIMSICPPWFLPEHQPSKKRLVFPNGVVARLFSGDVPASFRGPNYGFLWADELAHWTKLRDSWTNAILGLRHGERTRAVITTTPIGVQELIELLFEVDDVGAPIHAANDLGYQIRSNCRIVLGSSYDNALNLSEDYIADTIQGLDGTRLGEQEIHGRILLGVPSAPWSREWFRRVEQIPEGVELVEVGVAIDPATSAKGENCETGICVVGLGSDDRVYVLGDYSGNMSPIAWATEALRAYHLHRADWIAYEENQGGDLVRVTIEHARTQGKGTKGKRPKYKALRATRNKYRRAQLVTPLWEQGNAIHVGDSRRLRRMEHQLTHYDPHKSDRDQLSDRMDALVWAVIALVGEGNDRGRLRSLGRREVWSEVAKRLRDRSA